MKLSALISVALVLLVSILPNTILSQKRMPKNAKTLVAMDSLLIKNVYIISRDDTSGDVRVNMLIVDSMLEIVTKDDIVFGSGTKMLDGAAGYLMGNVVIGEVPAFVILKENPRKNFDVFLNTDDYIIFAMHKGAIVSNRLAKVSPTLDQPAALKKTGWTSYQPPPMAIPLNYYSKRKWNKFNTKYISGLFNGVIALDRLNWLTQDENSITQVGELESTSVGVVRAIRFGVVGTLNFKSPWFYTLFFTNNSFDRGYDATTGNKLLLYDLRLDIPMPGGLTLSVGKQKEPISMERLMPLMFLPMEEKAGRGRCFSACTQLWCFAQW